ncbi:hypothetical protein CYMTET_19449 [Cymbomonas tetramitiformis]|uniref:Uncharacterized protein n=1 Tax=Cymbomonas tetramitiformis TaxID=36881 RepID=A0AAE0G7C8_9CHLO|nr:hypothetical protein CYMTET_19449 [Cymbomonas tetramitiformis]|eukprot:gene1349-1950_t
MGLTQSVERVQRDAAMLSRLADLKQKKRERDIMLSMQVATTRDTLLWLGAFYTFMGSVSLGRNILLRRAGLVTLSVKDLDKLVLPINYVPYTIPMFGFGYTLDVAYFGKLDRIEGESQRIRSGEGHHWFDIPWLPFSDDGHHWFNKPMELPPTLESYYRRAREAEAKFRRENNLKGLDKDWACFPEFEATKEAEYK